MLECANERSSVAPEGKILILTKSNQVRSGHAFKKNIGDLDPCMYFVVGANMPDSELFELISENKSMSKTLAEYEGGIGCNYYGSFPKLSSEIFYLNQGQSYMHPPPLLKVVEKYRY